MPFAFLMPAFLAAVLAVAIPVMLHLRRRDRSKPAPFPSLMFLTRREIQTDQRRAVSDWPLLLLRALVIALLVLVFARPFLNRPLTATDPSIGLTVLVLDRSESMGHTAVADRWQDSARAVVSGLPGDARIAVVAFDAAARILVKPTTDHAQALAAIEAAPSPAGGTRFGSGLAAASQLLALERVPGEIVVVTDLQRSGTAATNAPALPAGTRVRVVPIQAAELGNLAVIDVGIEALPDDGNRRALVVARLRRVGGDAMHTVTARLQVDGREVAAVPVAVEPGGSQQVVFDTISVSRAAVRVAVSIDADDFTADDTFFAVLPPVTTTRITLVTPREASQAEFHHLVQALSIGRDPEFAIARVAALDAETIRESAAIILADVAPPDGQLGEALADAVNSGTGMILMVGRRLASRTGVLPLVPSRIRDVVVNIDGDGLDMASSGHPASPVQSTDP